MPSIQDVLSHISPENKARKVILPDITGSVIKRAILRLKRDGFSPVICGFSDEIQEYQSEIEAGLEFFEVAKGEDKLFFAAQKVLEWKVYGFLWWNNSTTADTVKAIIQAKKSCGFVQERLSSHFLSELWWEIILLADAALFNHHSSQAYTVTIEHAIHAAKKYGIVRPSVALLSFMTGYPELKEHEKWYIPHIAHMQEALRTIRQKFWEDYPIEWPCQFDAVMTPEIAVKKNPQTLFATQRPDILIFPSLDAGNIAYKILHYMWAPTLGPILSGTLHDLSRGASEEDIYQSFIINIL